MLFLSYHVDGRNGRGYASLEERGGCWDLGVDRGESECWVPPTRMLGILVGGCLDVVLLLKQVSDSKGTGDADPGCCFSLAISTEITNEVVPRRTRRGWGSRGSDLRVNRRGAEFWMPLMRVLELLWAVRLPCCCPARHVFFVGVVASESVVSLFSTPDAGVGKFMGGTLVGRCWNPYGWLS